MKISDLIRRATRNAFRSKARTILTVLSLFVGAFTLTLTTALGAGVSDYVSRQVASFGADDVLLVQRAAAASTEGPQRYDPNTGVATANTGTAGPLGASGGNLSEADLATIAGLPGVERVDPVQAVVVDWIQADASEKFTLSINPTSSITKADLSAGHQLDQTAAEREVILPADYVASLGFASDAEAVGAPVTLGLTDVRGDAHTIEATVVGVARASLLASGAGANQALVTELAQTHQAGLDAKAGYPVAIAYLDAASLANDMAAVKAELTAQGFTGQSIADQLGMIQTIINAITGVLSAFALIALLAAAFGIVNTLFMSVQERTREIGLMKAVGMSSRKVFTLFSLEAILIGFLGSVLGVVVAFGVGSAINVAATAGPLASLPGLNILLFQPQAMIGVILAIMAIAFLSGVLPARRAARKNPIDSLRYE